MEERKERWGGLLGPRQPGAIRQPTPFLPLRLTLLPTGLHVDLNQTEQVLGRHSQADVRLPLADVSRRHCRFTFTQGRWHVIDLASTNGTFVNEAAVQQAVLKDGDKLRVGSFTFEVKYLPAGTLATRSDLPGVRMPDQHQTYSAPQQQQRKAG